MTKKNIVGLLAGVAALTLACGMLYVKNETPFLVAVKVNLPGGTYGVRRLPAGEAERWQSLQSGSYTVNVMPEKAYMESLQKRRDKAMDAVFSDVPILDEETLKEVASALTDNAPLDILAGAGVSCSGKIPAPSEQDISAYDGANLPPETDVIVVVNYDQATNAWSCGEAKK